MGRTPHEGEGRPGLEAGRPHGSRRTGEIVTENGYPVKGLRGFCAAWWAATAVMTVLYWVVG